MKKTAIFIFTIAILYSQSTVAVYNANMVGVVTDVLTYTHSDLIFFRLSNQPTTHPECSTDYFSIDASVPSERRQQILSRLLTAYATGKEINIGFDNAGDCSHTRIRVHRVG